MDPIVQKQSWPVKGPGRKQCSSCQQYVGVKSATCVCGATFPRKGAVVASSVVVVPSPVDNGGDLFDLLFAMEEEAKPEASPVEVIIEAPETPPPPVVINIPSEPSPPAEVEPTPTPVVLGTPSELPSPPAPKPVAPKPAAPKTTKVRRVLAADRSRGLRITIPAGRCPVTLETPDTDAVVQWAHDVRESEPRDFLTIEALVYWVRHSFDPFSPEHKLAVATLEQAHRDGLV